jgi:hypothetical protein
MSSAGAWAYGRNFNDDEEAMADKCNIREPIFFGFSSGSLRFGIY